MPIEMPPWFGKAAVLFVACVLYSIILCIVVALVRGAEDDE
jgi:hypothetical protein